MISIDKIIQHLQQCKDTSITLPKPNSKYVQKNAVEIRKDELELLNTNFNQLNEANYTMDSEFDKLNKECENVKNSVENLPKTNNQKNICNEIIPHKSLIVYNENEIAQLPESILQLFNYFDPIVNVNLLYLYGVKNPDSFYKSFLFLYKVDFIIKNNTEKKNEVATFKREMAIHYETFYKNLNYRKLKFSRNDMVSNLTNVDNYTDYDIFQYIADYTKSNYIILDIITDKYININYTDNNIIPNSVCNPELYFIIVKYSSNTYLPLMNSSGNHYFSSKVLEYINKSYERLIFNKYKMQEQAQEQEQEQDLGNPARKEALGNPARKEALGNPARKEAFEKNRAKNNSENNIDIDDVDNIIDNSISSTFNIEEAFNNSIRLQNENSIINNKTNISNIFEDMIHIEEIEDKPMNNINHIEPTEPIEPVDDLQLLMTKIPMTKGSKIKIKKVEMATNIVQNNTVNNIIKEELLPIGKYNLLDLQRLSLLYKIDTQKMGTMGKKINKLKAELYNEISEKY